MPELFPFQDEGATYLAQHPHALLCDEMGLGKTVQAITAAVRVKAKRIIVICPAIARHNWAGEFKHFAPRYRPLVVESGRDLHRPPADADVLIVSYDLAVGSMVHAILAKFSADVLILDEGHALKNASAKRTRAIYGRLHKPGALIKYSRHVWVLTGTPMPNNPSELFPHFRALWPELLQESGLVLRSAFEDHFCQIRMAGYGAQIVGARNISDLKTLLGKTMLRRTKKQVLTSLPPLFWGEDITVKGSGEAMKAVAALDGHPEIETLKEILKSSASTEKPDMLGAAVATLRRLTGVAKAPAAAEFIADELLATRDHKIIVFAQHLEVLDILERILAPFGTVRIDGSVSGLLRKDRVDRFQKDPRIRVFLGQLQATSTAITLTAATSVIFAEASWVPADNVQGANRAHRIGQTGSVLVRFVTLANSIDEQVNGVLRRKSRMLNQVFEEQTA